MISVLEYQLEFDDELRRQRHEKRRAEFQGEAACRPIVKWAGGKTRLLAELLPRLPQDMMNYFEPFAGGVALFFAHLPVKAYISDVSSELINLYRVTQTRVDELISHMQRHVYDEDYFYSVRNADRTPDFAKWSEVERASRFLYLNKTCYNGLYRENSKGCCNTPFGRYTNPVIVDERNLRNCSRALKNALLECAPFEHILGLVKAGDFVYLDPPYMPRSKTSNFTGYSRGGFGAAMHEKLRDFCLSLDEIGVYFMLSNSCTEMIVDLYQGFRIETVLSSRPINSKSSGRGDVEEVLVRNY